MKQKLLITVEEVAEQTGIEKPVIEEIVSENLIFPAQREPVLLLFSRDVIRFMQVNQMTALGYTYDDIRRIIKDVGLPQDSNPLSSKENYFTIGDFCRKYDLSPRQLKFWEESGLFFPSVRSKGGVRLYNENLIIHVRFIQQLQTLGFTLVQIKDIILNNNVDIVETRINTLSDIVRDIRPILKNMKKIQK